MTIDVTQIPLELISFEHEINIEIDSEFSETQNDGPDVLQKEVENPLDAYRVGSDTSVLRSNIPSQIEEESIVLHGEGKRPLSILTDEKCEQIAFPYHFTIGKFGYMEHRRPFCQQNIVIKDYRTCRSLHWIHTSLLENIFI